MKRRSVEATGEPAISPPLSRPQDPLADHRRRSSGRRFSRLGIAAAIAVAVAALGYALAWGIAALQVRTAAETWIDERRVEGYTVELSEMEIGGFPSALRFRVGSPRIASPTGSWQWAWSAGRLTAEMDPFRWNRPVITVEGEQVIDLPGEGGSMRVRATAAEFSLSPELDGHRPAGSVRARDLRFDTEQGQQVVIGDLVASGRPPMAPASGGPAATYAVRLDANDLRMQAAIDLPLGPDLQRLAVEALLVGNLDHPPTREALLRWRDDGGTVEVVRLDVGYGPLALTGNGTLALDKAAQPTGAFSVRVQGLVETIETLQQRGLVQAGVTSTVRLLWGVFARRPAEGGPPAIDLPLTIQDRTVSLGPAKIAKLPEIEW